MWELCTIYSSSELERIRDALDNILKCQNFDFIDLENIEDELLKDVYLKITTISKQLQELNDYSSALGSGRLDITPPPRNNNFVGSLKNMQSNLLHIAWKVSQISKGDYNQKVDFMGQFSESFNDMALKLKTRELQLSESRSIVEVLFQHSNIMIFIIDAYTNELIYCKEKEENTQYTNVLSHTTNHILEKLQNKSTSITQRSFDWDLFSDIDSKWYNVKSRIMSWNDNEEVYFHMLFDISDQKEIQAELASAALKDPSTGIYNTSYALDAITKLFSKQDIFCVCFLDLDELKFVNDNYGHITGDRLIKKFTEIVSQEIRIDDVFCRVGGDEFLIITPNANESTTLKIIQRIENQIDKINKSGEEKFIISFSYGIEFSEKNSKALPKSIIDSADKKMYEQKREKKLLRKKMT